MARGEPRESIDQLRARLASLCEQLHDLQMLYAVTNDKELLTEQALVSRRYTAALNELSARLTQQRLAARY